MVTTGKWETNERIVGCWDFEQLDTRLGSLFIFIHELNCAEKSAGTIHFFSVLPQHQGLIDACQRFSKHHIVVNDLSTSDIPSLIHDQLPPSTTSRTGSMQWIGRLYAQGKRVQPCANTSDCLSKNTDKTVVAVHLKNNPNDIQSNADHDAWLSAFVTLSKRYDSVKFVIVGDDDIPTAIALLDCVEKFQGSVGDYFSVVCEADAFIGMSSAFCAAAILGAKPYRVWKHIGHHTDIMARELNRENQFPFAIEGQKMCIAHDTVDNIVTETSNMLQAMKYKG